MARPTEEVVLWAAQDVALPALAGPNKVLPITDLINKGWDMNQKPAADEFNYILNNLGKYVNWLSTEIADPVIDATNLNTPDTLVLRDGSGNFSAGSITASLNGNASTASKWQTARTLTLNGYTTGSANIDGSGNVSLTTSMGGGFTSIKAANGYTTLPNGIIIQWGSLLTGAIGNNVSGTKTFPITFPTGVFQVVLGSISGLSGGAVESGGGSVTAITNSNFTWDSEWMSRDDNYGALRYIAIGY